MDTNFPEHNQATEPRPSTRGNMRGSTRQRPVSLHGPQPTHMHAATRKIFNCIADDSALVAGVKKSTRNGIRQWVKNGQIRLFVPLHALEQLSRQRSAANRHGEDVRDTLQWLDDATTRYPHAVTLQGPDQYYQQWSEVERFAVPRTLFSEDDHMDAPEPEAETETSDLPDQTAAKLTIADANRHSPVSSAPSAGSEFGSPSSMQSVRSSISPVSPPTSPHKAASSPAKPYRDVEALVALPSSSAIVPLGLQSLFNYILWRIHQELDPIAALESFIFLCNDPQKVHYAKGFDIRCKRLEQLREVVGREDRDLRNRTSMQNRENHHLSAPVPILVKPQNHQDDDEVIYKPPPRGPAAMTQRQPTNVIDPNAFGRTPPPPEQAPMPPKSPRFMNSQPFRGGPNMQFSPRGNGMRGNFRGGRGRGNFVPGRGGFAPGDVTPDTQPAGQIDPDSFARPRGGFAGRGTRKLWVPT